MNIQELKDKNSPKLKAFEKQEWIHADKEHYGENLPDFTKTTYTYIAQEDKKIIGFIKFTTDLGVACIDSLMVGRTAQRKGIGSQLVQKAEQEAKKLGCHKVWLETGVDWSARKLYESLGYTLRCTLPKYYAKKDFVILDKEI